MLAQKYILIAKKTFKKESPINKAFVQMTSEHWFLEFAECHIMVILYFQLKCHVPLWQLSHYLLLLWSICVYPNKSDEGVSYNDIYVLVLFCHTEYIAGSVLNVRIWHL